jgi:signal-transduction protein with cAMP-binding, CBS, and nucleotidyltransferase domain
MLLTTHMELLRVSELMTKDVIHMIDQDASVEEAARRMKQVGRGCLVVVKRAQPVGIITERDLVQKVMAEQMAPKNVRVSQIMSTPPITVGPEALVSDAANIMLQNKIRRLIVTEGDQIVGILTVTDFAKLLHKHEGSDPMLAAMARATTLLSQTLEQSSQ